MRLVRRHYATRTNQASLRTLRATTARGIRAPRLVASGSAAPRLVASRAAVPLWNAEVHADRRDHCEAGNHLRSGGIVPIRLRGHDHRTGVGPDLIRPVLDRATDQGCVEARPEGHL